MAQNNLFQNLCRICTNRADGISIYSKEGKEFSLEEKINKYLSIQVKEEDKLPKMVCLLCRNKLDIIQKFSVMATNSQNKLLECLKSQKIIHSEAEKNDAKECGELLPVELPEDSAFDKDIKGSLLHSILTKGHISNAGDDVTEMEVTIDPMLFFEEDVESESEKGDVISSKTVVTSEREFTLPQIFEVKPYQCTLCPRGFNSDLSLKNHLWNHLPSKKILVTSDLNRLQTKGGFASAAIRHRRIYNSQCLCQECGRIYPTKSTLRAHQVTHSNLRPHKCSLCDKTFKRNQDLK
uniref:Uncharacterized protein n=3 Tax=Rhodnius prolixus TaxID=13249 RepID=T1I151_RHOPR